MKVGFEDAVTRLRVSPPVILSIPFLARENFWGLAF